MLLINGSKMALALIIYVFGDQILKEILLTLLGALGGLIIFGGMVEMVLIDDLTKILIVVLAAILGTKIFDKYLR